MKLIGEYHCIHDLFLYRIIKDNKTKYCLSEKDLYRYKYDIEDKVIDKETCLLNSIELFCNYYCNKDIIEFDNDNYLCNYEDIINNGECLFLDNDVYILEQRIYREDNEDFYSDIYVYDYIEDINKLFNEFKPDKFNDQELSLYRLTKDLKVELIKEEYIRYNEEIKEEYKDYYINLIVNYIPYGRWKYTIRIDLSFKYSFIKTVEDYYLRYKANIYSDIEFLQIFFEDELEKAINEYNIKRKEEEINE